MGKKLDDVASNFNAMFWEMVGSYVRAESHKPPIDRRGEFWAGSQAMMYNRHTTLPTRPDYSAKPMGLPFDSARQHVRSGSVSVS